MQGLYNLNALYPATNPRDGSAGFMAGATNAYGSMQPNPGQPPKTAGGALSNAFGGMMVGSALQEAGMLGAAQGATAMSAGSGVFAGESAMASVAPSMMAGPAGLGIFAGLSALAYLLS